MTERLEVIFHTSHCNHRMKLKWILTVCVATKVRAFVPHQGPSTTLRSKTIRGAGIGEFVGEKFADLSHAVSSVSNPPEFDKLSNEVSRAIIQTLPPGVDESMLKELIAAATTPYHIAAIGLFTLASCFMLFINSPDDYSEAPFEPGTNTYNPKASEEFYNKRPLMVVRRILKLALLTGSFNTGILFDWLILGKLFKDEEYTALKRAEPKRAKQSLYLCEQLGPTFISELYFVESQQTCFV